MTPRASRLRLTLTGLGVDVSALQAEEFLVDCAAESIRLGGVSPPFADQLLSVEKIVPQRKV